MVDCTPQNYEEICPREYHGISFVMNNLKMKGVCSYNVVFYFGLFADSITYNNCYFIGKQSAYSSKVVFNDCTFDSTNFPDKPDYSIYSYAPYDIEFNRCNFLSDGKAIKIYSEGIISAVFKFTECNFAIKTKRSDKAAIQVDSSIIGQSGFEYDVYITRCHQKGYEGGLYNDSANPSYTNFIITDE